MSINIPEFVKWYGEDIIEEAKAKIIKKYGIDGIKDIDVSAISFDELREVVTVVSNIGYDEVLYKQIPYEHRKKLEDKLNNEFNKRLGDEMVLVYNIMDKNFNKEKYGGERRYELLTLDNRKGYSEMTALKNTIWFMKMKGRKITVKSAIELNEVMNNGLFWEFGYEVKEVIPFNESEENFKICNLGRRKEIQAQNNFVKFVFDGDIESAYEMIKPEIVRRDIGR